MPAIKRPRAALRDENDVPGMVSGTSTTVPPPPFEWSLFSAIRSGWTLFSGVVSSFLSGPSSTSIAATAPSTPPPPRASAPFGSDGWSPNDPQRQQHASPLPPLTSTSREKRSRRAQRPVSPASSLFEVWRAGDFPATTPAIHRASAPPPAFAHVHASFQAKRARVDSNGGSSDLRPRRRRESIASSTTSDATASSSARWSALEPGRHALSRSVDSWSSSSSLSSMGLPRSTVGGRSSAHMSVESQFRLRQNPSAATIHPSGPRARLLASSADGRAGDPRPRRTEPINVSESVAAVRSSLRNLDTAMAASTGSYSPSSRASAPPAASGRHRPTTSRKSMYPTAADVTMMARFADIRRSLGLSRVPLTAVDDAAKRTIADVDEHHDGHSRLAELLEREREMEAEINAMREQFPGYGAPRRRSSREVDNGSSPGDIWALEDDAADRVAQLISRGIASASVRLVFNETVELLGKDLATVAPAEWLNDEIINYYGLLVMARAKTALAAATTAAAAGAAPGGGAALRVHYFNSFFFSKLRDIGYSSVRRWSKKFDVFDDLDMLVFPVHWGAHWTLGCVNVAARRIEYYDSLLGNEDKEFFRLVRGYVENEWIKKDRGPMCWDGWTEHYPRDAIPRQLNYYDCGVFTLAMLESITRSARRFAFDQSHMDAWRHRIVHELSEGRLIT